MEIDILSSKYLLTTYCEFTSPISPSPLESQALYTIQDKSSANIRDHKNYTMAVTTYFEDDI